MAIIIPSANIYEMQNDKILDNQISGVEGKINAFDNQNKLEHKETINLDYSDITNNFSQNTNYKQITFGNRPFANPNITVYYVKFYYDFSIKEDIFLLNNLTVKTENLNSSNNADYERDIWQIYNPNYSGDISFAIVNNETEFDNLEEANWGKVGLQRLNTNLFRLYLKVVYLGVVNTAFPSFNIGDIVAKSKERTISFYAYKQIEKTVIYGLSNNVDSLNKNELIQDTTKNGTKKISEYLANNIISSYKNGKETATIRCSINDYKNEDETIAKSITDTTKDMTFRMYDNVIPMIPSPNGDVPMSKHKDGTNKIFKVLGTKLINNGAVWQELTLQERLRDKYIKFEIDGIGTNTISARANSTSGTTTGISSNRTMQYSLNGKDWNSWDGSALTITTSQPIYLRSNITANGGNGLYTNFFFGNSTTKIKCSGDMRYMAMTNNYAEISNTVPFAYCYRYMFYNCTSLTTAPSLPATTLATYCYDAMFYNCTSLTTAPSLPATTLANSCYRSMFYNCTSLTTAPSLPATTLADFCYYEMFNSCTSLTTAPSLPATTLANNCYRSMFYNCTSLTTAPSLPATTLANNCYRSMFYNCTSLTTAPSLPATTLADFCYYEMFNSCTSLTTAPSLPATTLADFCYYEMFNSCTSLTTAPSLPATTLADFCYYEMFNSCTSLTTAPSLPATTLADSCYYYMFYNCTSLTAAPSLLATTLASACYYGMFYSCTSLTTAPSLPATTLANSCYSSMFRNCTSLATAPSLPATTLAHSCYSSMFYNCTSLTTAPSLPATTLADFCYLSMFYSCTSLTTAPSLPATTLATYCYRSMFYNCTSLTTAPSLPATTLADSCYYGMFYNCTALTQVLININNNTTIPTSALTDMLANTGTVSQPPNAIYCDRTTIIADTNATSRWIRQPNAVQDEDKYIKFEIDGDGTNTISARANSTSGTARGISSNRTMQYSLNGIDWNSWDGSALTITTSQPIYLRSNITANGGDELYTNFFFGNSTTKIKCSGDMRYMAMTNNYAEISNTVPFTYCYRYMFYNCTSLTAAPSLPATTLTTYCYRGMFYNCTSLTAAPSLPATTLANFCYYYMFENCTSLTAAPSLPATTLTTYCYRGMFYNCTSLTAAPSLPATTLATACYTFMFYNCTSLTTITLYYGGEGSYFSNWVSGISTEGVLYKAGTQFASCGNNTYPCTWTQVQI